MLNNWLKEFSAAVTVCDLNGKIIEMNDRSAETFKDDGGYQLIGKSLFNCHSDNSVAIIKDLIAKKSVNVYTIEKKE